MTGGSIKKYILFFVCLCLLCTHGFAEISELDQTPAANENTSSPHIFHNIGWNAVNSVTYNYGLNFVGAGVGTWGMIKTGLDWNWRNTVFESSWMPHIGGPVMAVGGLVPIMTPLVLYFTGRGLEDKRLKVTAAALTQTLMVTMAVQSPMKMITGRRDPGLVDNSFYRRVYGEDDFSGVFNWFNMDFINGWPSGHTANAFSAAATIAEIYHDNIWVKIGVYTYATFIGFGTTTVAHWASEAVAGALIGYAIGKTVGRSYRQFLEKDKVENNISFYATPFSAGINIRL
ncbi:MAG: phosphatase PAP2 family protein [Treponema sp.]|nr:phosphatase PAP2 family protein [Treponema sp.]